MDRPRLEYVGFGAMRSGRNEACDALYFPLPYGEDVGQGRVTFEDLDAARVCRGEHMPYPGAAPYRRGDWVYEISDSPWLLERHEYEVAHYRTPLLETYRHYLFVFHGEFVEVIAQGIWFDRPDPADPSALPVGHPLRRLDGRAAPEIHTSPTGIVWELRRNPEAVPDLVAGSRLCSQRLYQFNFVFDGQSSESASVWLRTAEGRTTARLDRDWVGTFATLDGVPSAEDFFEVWEAYVAEVAARRREMGKVP
ncbi:hypothetical protein ABIA31_005387 [Catenulispora sp. MAP5-51]